MNSWMKREREKKEEQNTHSNITRSKGERMKKNESNCLQLHYYHDHPKASTFTTKSMNLFEGNEKKKEKKSSQFCSFTFLSIDLRKKEIVLRVFYQLCLFIWLSADRFSRSRSLVSFIASICVLNKMFAKKTKIATGRKKEKIKLDFHLFNAGHSLLVCHRK